MGKIEHREIRKFEKSSMCSCGKIHPIDEKGGVLTGFVAECSCGRIHPLIETEDGKLVVDTGWY